MERNAPGALERVESRMQRMFPELKQVGTMFKPDGSLALRLDLSGRNLPLDGEQVSGGMLDTLTLLLALEDRGRNGLVIIGEPDRDLHPGLVEELAQQLRGGPWFFTPRPQVLAETHRPDLLDCLAPQEVWILERDGDGFHRPRRADDDPVARAWPKRDCPWAASGSRDTWETGRNPGHGARRRRGQ